MIERDGEMYTDDGVLHLPRVLDADGRVVAHGNVPVSYEDWNRVLIDAEDAKRALALLTRLARGEEIAGDPGSGWRCWHDGGSEHPWQRWVSFDARLQGVDVEDLALLNRLAGEAGQSS